MGRSKHIGEQGRIQDFGKGGGGLITIFTSGGGYGGGVPSPVTARGSGGTLIVPQPLFLLWRLFSMKIHILLTAIST